MTTNGRRSVLYGLRNLRVIHVCKNEISTPNLPGPRHAAKEVKFSSKSAPERKIYMIKEHEERRTIRSTKRALYYHPVAGWRSKEGGTQNHDPGFEMMNEWTRILAYSSAKKGEEKTRNCNLFDGHKHTLTRRILGFLVSTSLCGDVFWTLLASSSVEEYSGMLGRCKSALFCARWEFEASLLYIFLTDPLLH